MQTQPVRGMRDTSPKETALRDYLLSIITRTAESHGFHHIETPSVEHLANLTSGEGGENESLIFKILKRGADLERALATASDISDSGLRYDLTVPLARYYAAYQNDLPSPFKSLQIAPVWRADRPQRGRYRQFTQCDLDILGDSTNLAEIDAISTTISILKQLLEPAGITDLTVRINDRRILSAAVLAAGFTATDETQLLISLDKLDKIGIDGIRAELIEHKFDPAKINTFLAFFEGQPTLADFAAKLPTLDEKITANLEQIIANLPDAKVAFDPTLARGMSYYTGPVFEYTAGGFSSSIGGGGRYDRMVGKFTGRDVPATGSSIGFERILVLLEDAGFTPPANLTKTALLLSSDLTPDQLKAAFAEATDLRTKGQIVSLLPMRRNLDHQITALESLGYTTIEKIYSN